MRKLLAVLATGLGKTVIAAHIPAFFPGKRTLFLVHTDELMAQGFKKMTLCNPGVKVGVEMGSQFASTDDRIIVASVPTLGREGSSRLLAFNPADFGAIIVDECQHSTGDTYERIFSYFGVLGTENPHDLLLLGITATPGRSDGVGLARIFDKVVFNYGLLDGIRDGWLCNARAVRVRTRVNLDSVSCSNREFDKEELSLAINTPERNQLVAEEWLKHAKGLKTLGFVVTIQHGKDLAAEFVRQGVRAAAVWGVDPDREAKIAAHQAGDLEVLLNVNVLTEGYDDPTIQCILLGAPTNSQLRYMQRIGRGTRIPEGVQNLHDARAAGILLTKEEFLLLDYTDACTKHSPVTFPSIFGLPKDLEFRGRPITEVVEEYEQAVHDNPDVDFRELTDLSDIERYVEHVDLFTVKFAPEVESNSIFQWHKSDGGYILALPRGESITIKQNLLEQWSIHGMINGSEFDDSEKDLETAFHSADNMLRFFGRNLIAYLRRENPSKKGKEPATDRQKRAIVFHCLKSGKAVPSLDRLNNFEASKLLRKLSAA
jgi:ATP-dependent helicase IRC3